MQLWRKEKALSSLQWLVNAYHRNMIRIAEQFVMRYEAQTHFLCEPRLQQLYRLLLPGERLWRSNTSKLLVGQSKTEKSFYFPLSLSPLVMTQNVTLASLIVPRPLLELSGGQPREVSRDAGLNFYKPLELKTWIIVLRNESFSSSSLSIVIENI